MSIFDKLLGGDKPQKPNIDESKFITVAKSDFKDFNELFEQNAGLSFEKQMILSDVIGNQNWELDMDSGSMFFETMSLPIQIMGSLAFEDNTWMWGWANDKSGMPENLLVQARKLKEIGEQKNIDELKEGHYAVEEGFEHKIGMIAAGLFNTKCYYCANYGKGTLVVTIDDENIPAVDKDRFEKIITGFPQLISGIGLNHKNAFKNYLIDRDFTLNITQNKIEGMKGKTLLTAEFDDAGRLTSLNGNL